MAEILRPKSEDHRVVARARGMRVDRVRHGVAIMARGGDAPHRRAIARGVLRHLVALAHQGGTQPGRERAGMAVGHDADALDRTAGWSVGALRRRAGWWRSSPILRPSAGGAEGIVILGGGGEGRDGGRQLAGRPVRRDEPRGERRECREAAIIGSGKTTWNGSSTVSDQVCGSGSSSAACAEYPLSRRKRTLERRSRSRARSARNPPGPSTGARPRRRAGCRGRRR